LSNPDTYKSAYERELVARKTAEKLLDDKTRNLYDSVGELKKTITALEDTQDKLVHSEKMASIGQLAAGVAHEINNPIGFSISNLNTLSEYVESFVKLDKFVTDNLPSIKGSDFEKTYQTLREKEDINFIIGDLTSLLNDTVNGLNRVSAIVTNLNKVSHASELEMELADINEVINESLKVVWNELKYNMEIKKNLIDVPYVFCHPGEIQQVLMNLFINAFHACVDKGILTVSTSIIKGQNRDWLVINVADNGKGMSRDVKKKIFEPFFTTKPVGVGTGLGLSVSFGIIEKHEGNIEVISEEGVGTTFIITLPFPAH
jgi:signal transduction histidine kinase